MHNKNVLKESKLSILATFGAAGLSSFSLTLIPFVSRPEEGSGKIISYFIAAGFWIGLLLTFVSAHFTKKTLRRYRERWIAKGRLPKRQSVGAIAFSTDWKMWLLYGVTLLGMALIVTDIFLGYMPEMVMFPVVSATIFLFTVHCVMDGKYYKVYKLLKEGANNETNRQA